MTHRMNIVFLSGSSNPLSPDVQDRRFTAVDLSSSQPTSSIAARFAREPRFSRVLDTIGYKGGDEETNFRKFG